MTRHNTHADDDRTAHITDEQIADAIESQGAPASVDEVREILELVQESFEEVWGIHMDNVEDGDVEVVADDGDVVVLADHFGAMWNDEFEHGKLGEMDIDPQTRSAVQQVHHTVADEYTSYSWESAWPFVVRKPESHEAGERYVEAVVNSLVERGLSPGQAWAVWGVKIRGHSRNQWAKRLAYSDHSAVSEAVRKAEKKIELPY